MVQSEPAVFSPPLLPSLQGPDFLPLLAVNPVCALRALRPLPLVCIDQPVECHILHSSFLVFFYSLTKCLSDT
jgi:hypothetical protein